MVLQNSKITRSGIGSPNQPYQIRYPNTALAWRPWVGQRLSRTAGNPCRARKDCHPVRPAWQWKVGSSARSVVGDIEGCNGLGIRGQTFILDNADRFSKDLNIINGRNTVTGEEGTDSSDGCFPSGALEEAENHQARSPGSVLVSEGTHRLARKFFAFVHLNLCGSRGNRSRLRPGGSSGRRRSTRGSRRP